VTTHKLLEAGGLDPLRFPDEVISDLQNPKKRWGYLDQTHTFPELHELAQLRTDMVKRPILATIEKLLCPIQCTQRHLLVTGYTHPPYKEKTKILLEHSSVTDFLIIRGTEGATQLPGDKRAPYTTGKKEGFLKSTDYKIELQDKIYPDSNITVEQTLQLGMKALQGEENEVFQVILYNAVALLDSFKLETPQKSLETCSSLLKSGKAFSYWQ